MSKATVTSGSHSIVVGAGGAAVVGSNQAGLNGGNSSAFGHTAIGGGGGSNRDSIAGKFPLLPNSHNMYENDRD